LRANTDFGATCAPIARPKRIAHSPAFLFSTGKTPGSATVDRAGLRVRLGAEGGRSAEKIFETVESCACVSMPITTSHDSSCHCSETPPDFASTMIGQR
jgi:hypothetical protein